MSTHPSTPQPLININIRGGPLHRQHHDSMPWVMTILIFLSAGLLVGMTRYLVGRVDEPATQPEAPAELVAPVDVVLDEIATENAASDDAPDRRRQPQREPTPIPLAAGFPDLNDLDAWEAPWTEGLFESEAQVAPSGTIDDHVFANLAERGIEPARLCSDATFLRRVYIDTIGTIPGVEEVEQFLSDPDPSKRAKLIDALLERPEFADYWAMKWSDILRVKAEFPINLWPNAAQAYHRWIRTSIHDNLPYDEFAYQLLTSSGSNFRRPQVNFYRALQSQESDAIAKAVALTFLGERAEKWPPERLEGMSQFFSKVGYKPTGEWKEEIVFFDARRGDADQRGDADGRRDVKAIFPNGFPVTVPADQDPREVFADWLIDERNPWFSRAIANRVWYWLLGRGIVHPADDVRSDNPPSNPDLLAHLGDELVAADYDLRHLYRLILNSTTYQLACVPRGDGSRDREHFAAYQPRRLDAEVLIDAICQITGTTETYMSIIPEPFTFLPPHQRAIALPDGSITSSFLELFGRPARDTGLESERNNRLTAGQALHLINSNHIRDKIRNGTGTRKLLAGDGDSVRSCERIYLAILSRPPNEYEAHAAAQLCETPGGQHELVWALINSDEFLFRH